MVERNIKSDRPPIRTAVLIYSGAQVLDFAGPVEIMGSCDAEAKKFLGREEPCYDITILAEKAGPISTSCGMSVHADVAYQDFNGPADLLMISGGNGTRKAVANPIFIETIQSLAVHASRITSVCSGAFGLAAAGLLEGKRATTHWGVCDAFQKRYPNVTLEPDSIYVRDGNVWTSAGVTTGMDMTLAIVAEDWGEQVALGVAQREVMYMIRPGGQSQFSSRLSEIQVKDAAIRRVTEWIFSNLAAPLNVPSLAEHATLSERTFARRFTDEVGMPPGKFIEQARLEAAREALERSKDPVDRVAMTCGFGSSERMRRVFHRHLAVSPHDYRERFRTH